MPVNFNGPPVHLLIGDPSGKSVIVEFDADNMGYKEGKENRFEVMKNEFEKNTDKINKEFIENVLYKVRMSDKTRDMNQTLNYDINTVIRLVYDLNNKEVYITTGEDDFKKDYKFNF